MRGQALVGGDPAVLRRLNLEAVLHALRGREPMTTSQISKASSLSRQTVDQVLDDLARLGWVEEVAPGKSIGRPARRHRFRADAGHVLGVDVGAHSVLLVLADLDGRLIETRRAALDAAPAGEGRLAAVRGAAADLLADHPATRLRALCVGVPGIVDGSGRVRLSTPLPEWNGLHLAEEASGWFGCPAFAENDANLAALAEHWRGAAQGTDDFIQLLTGHRTGAALVLGGRLHRGRTGAAGEIAGLAILGWDGSDLADLRGEADTAQVFAAAAEGDPAAVARVDRFARTYAQGTAAMVLTVNPDLVVISGGISVAGEILAGPMRHHLGRLCLDAPEVRASRLGPETVALGAVRLALDHVDRHLFDFRSAPEPQPAEPAGAPPAPADERPLNQDVFELRRTTATT
ncbi:ROK family transcriptional regulator [Kitasatospora sp. NA04385]|uniref:ROK family transcriptional regulator n=1 Tax=Kitasatospora sp. NA04385 TaxID=2742135 RepID=UPI001590923A|nr:ROK family transcriptional regulator [Kitasatospora sp. NA04385]QKW17756.1 ROK family transcriptional regulator [Kitasatospora sp. NA04385]